MGQAVLRECCLLPWSAQRCQGATSDTVPHLQVVTTQRDAPSYNEYSLTCQEPHSPLKQRQTYDGFSSLSRGQSCAVFQPYGFDTRNIPRIKVQGKLQSLLYLVKLLLLVALICGLQLDSPPEKNKELLFCKDVQSQIKMLKSCWQFGPSYSEEKKKRRKEEHKTSDFFCHFRK